MASSQEKGKRKCLSVDEKMKILDYVTKNPGKTQGEVACHFSLAQPTVSSILKRRNSIMFPW